jgi:hypothetical protein
LTEIQGTEGYMAPELEEILRKIKITREVKRMCFVGRAILQMYTLQSLMTLNLRENNEKLMEKVNSVHYE